MTTRTPRSPKSLVLLVLLVLLLVSGSAGAIAPAAGAAPDARDDARWSWPVGGAHVVVAPFVAPAHEFGAGHRGIDVSAPIGAAVRAPAPGVVAFQGVVVDRPLLTIEHEGGYVSTFEPLISTLAPGQLVAAGAPIGTVATGGHADPGMLHIGVRLNGTYINPLLLFGEVERAVLLPCCEPL